MKYRFLAPTLFGIEGIAAGEFKRLGFNDVSVQDGRVYFTGDDDTLARANIFSRFAERILIVIGEFKATTFTELFDNVKSLNWADYIDKRDAFPVTGSSINSALHSIPDCQSIIKKAIVEKLKLKYNISYFEETGTQYKVKFTINKDLVTVALDTSGEGLHKRGYRRDANAAPLRESMAAAICDLGRIYPDTQFIDPMCGSGTLLIEAALMAKNIAPGIRRSFAGERFSFVDEGAWRQARAFARDSVRGEVDFHAYGYDIDDDAIALTKSNAKKAGVDGLITVEKRDIRDYAPVNDRFLLAVNPPYGERLLDIEKAEELYKIMGRVFKSEQGHKYMILSPHDEFEKLFSRPADKRRKLYNGMIKCQLYMYFFGR